MVHGHRQITKEHILDKLSEEELFKFYCPNFEKLDVNFISNLRKDSKASCRITDYGGYLLYKDFGVDEPGTNIWGYIMRKYGVKYLDTFDIIASDFGLSNSDVKYAEHTVNGLSKTSSSKRTIIKIKVRSWMLIDKNYWYEKYGITKEILTDFSVRPITNFWINDNLFYSDSNCYSYDYYVHDNRLLRKIYQPLNKDNKWYSNIDNTVVQGINNIPKFDDLLIITKSLKDIMCLKQLGYNAVAPNNEITWLPESVWNKFLNRYKQMFIFFDNDDPGRFYAQKFSNQYGIPYFYLPIEDNVKDISDYINKYRDIDKAKQLLKNLIW